MVLVANSVSDIADQLDFQRAQRFTTGGNPTGYRVLSVSVEFGTVGGNASSSDTHLTVWSHDGGPDEQVGALVSPSTLESDSANTFTGDVLLDADTQYWLLANHGLQPVFGVPVLFNAADHRETSDYGWSIANSSLVSTDN